MSALQAVNDIARETFREYGEDARHINQNGEVRQITVIRFDPYVRQDIEAVGVSTTDPSVWVLTSELSDPQVKDQIVTDDNETFLIRDVEPHKRRGYARLHLYSDK